MSWTDYSSAPAPGTPICAEAGITAVHPLTIRSERGEFPLILLRDGDKLRAYVNACPHQYLPLNYRGEQLLSADGAMLLCTNHGARFDISTGRVIEGADCGLDPVPVSIAEGMVVIGE
ncbi:Rieske (2Fe-2S) protein [Paracoccus marinaquae]|uniref:Rieske 2Fe-2S domain-containing protein n=1 Tax=Paracoccus marinaquae TaxID=2841926 RepID=A0ABS6ALM2_9RHOB|nr:Rieske 2Fe-2S domain-containing protein [Paracoccus marinaquae]MBU3030535.1 Rieske 2Fe-2S domain-containing protein [Paracoccus marinaquae]